MDAESALEFSRLKMRVGILESLVLRNDVAVPVLVGKQTLSESAQRTLSVLEETASYVERQLLGDSVFQSLDDSERALYADEFREIVERMKSYVSEISQNYKRK